MMQSCLTVILSMNGQKLSSSRRFSGSAFHTLSAMNNAHCLAIVRAKRNRCSFLRHDSIGIPLLPSLLEPVASFSVADQRIFQVLRLNCTYGSLDTSADGFTRRAPWWYSEPRPYNVPVLATTYLRRSAFTTIQKCILTQANLN